MAILLAAGRHAMAFVYDHAKTPDSGPCSVSDPGMGEALASLVQLKAPGRWTQ
jgi:hypothetical protein